MKCLRFWPKKLTLVIYTLLLAGFTALFDWSAPLSYLAGDSLQYIQFSELIFNDAFLKADHTTPYSLILRTPGFPLLLALGKLVAGGDLRLGLLTMHVGLAVLGMILLCEAFRPYLPRILTGSVVVLLFRYCGEIFPAVMTEWSSIALLIIFYATFLKYLQSQTLIWFYLGTACISCLILTRPVFSYIIIIPFYFLIERRMLSTKPFWRCAGFLLALSPLLLWMTLNLVRIGNFTVSPAGAVSLFAVVSALGEVPTLPSDNATTVKAFNFINAARLTFPKTEYEKLSDLAVGEGFRAIALNSGIVEKLREQMFVPWSELMQIIKLYCWRGILNHREDYTRYVLQSLLSLKFSLFLLVPAFLVPIRFLFIKMYQPVAKITLLFLLIHIGQVVTTAAFGIIHARYYNVTFFPLIAVSLLVSVLFCLGLLKGERAA